MTRRKKGKPVHGYDVVIPRIGTSITRYATAVLRQFELMGSYTPNPSDAILRARDKLRAHLRDRGIETLVHWPKPMWEHKGLQLDPPQLPQTEQICREVLSLPMSAETTDEQVCMTAEAIREFL